MMTCQVGAVGCTCSRTKIAFRSPIGPQLLLNGICNKEGCYHSFDDHPESSQQQVDEVALAKRVDLQPGNYRHTFFQSYPL